MTPVPAGTDLIAAERTRQIEQEGWDQIHDEGHDRGELAQAAACYANPDLAPRFWPWEWRWWKPTPDNRVRELTKAGALIAAEIDRLLPADAVSNSPFSTAEICEIDGPGYVAAALAPEQTKETA